MQILNLSFFSPDLTLDVGSYGKFSDVPFHGEKKFHGHNT